MIRVKRGKVAKNRRKKIVKMNKGFGASSRSLFRIANQKYVKAKISSYRDRRRCKRLFRNLWIHRMNSALRLYGLSFNQFIYLCRKSKILLNRKMISQLVIYDPESFFYELKSYLI